MAVEIHQDNGNRKIIVDLWDPTSSPTGNDVSVWGQFSLFGEVIVNTGDDDGSGGFVPGVIDEDFGSVA